MIRSLFRTSDGTPVSVKPFVHVGMLQDSVLIIDREGRTVDFRYFPMGRGMEPYHISDGLQIIKVRNLGERAVYFGKTGREVVCPPGEITTIPAAEHDCEGLFSPDAVNGKGLYKKLFSKDGGETDDRYHQSAEGGWDAKGKGHPDSSEALALPGDREQGGTGSAETGGSAERAPEYKTK